MTAYDLNDFEAELIDALRAGTPDDMGKQMHRATSAALDERGMLSEPVQVAPVEPKSTYTPRPYSKGRLWLIRHGIEWEWSDYTGFVYDRFQRHFAIVINHRYYGVDFHLHIVPFKGAYDDELNTPHKDIAAQYEQGRR